MLDKDPNSWRELLESASFFGAIGLLGRMVWHLLKVISMERPLFGRELLVEIPLAVFGGLVGAGIGRHLGLEHDTLWAFVAVTAYLGPKGIEALVQKFLKSGS